MSVEIYGPCPVRRGTDVDQAARGLPFVLMNPFDYGDRCDEPAIYRLRNRVLRRDGMTCALHAKGWRKLGGTGWQVLEIEHEITGL